MSRAHQSFLLVPPNIFQMVASPSVAKHGNFVLLLAMSVLAICRCQHKDILTSASQMDLSLVQVRSIADAHLLWK